MKIIAWTPEEAKVELAKRLSYCINTRRRFEVQWAENERTLYSVRGDNFASSKVQLSFDNFNELGVEGVDTSGSNFGINYAFKNYRLIHSQMSANPPTVIPRPTSPDPADRRKADAADRISRYAMRQYGMQETFDLANSQVLTYGTAFIKTVNDPTKGDIINFDETTGEVMMDGDLDITTPSTWNIYVDPDATVWRQVKYIFERMYLPYEQAISMFPDKKEELEKYRTKQQNIGLQNGTNTIAELARYDVVEVYQYWETALPYNGMIGRFCFHLNDGTLLTSMQPNPYAFRAPNNHGVDLPGENRSNKKEMPAKAALPYHIITDINLPGTIWGQSFVSYEAPLQELYNRMLNVSTDVLQAHGIPRMILPEGADVDETSITNSPWDIVKISGNATPYFMQPLAMPSEFTRVFETIRQGIDDMAGVNESMFGQQSREQSGFSMQYATNQGNLIRKNLFNKQVLMVEQVFKGVLNLVRKHWTETRQIYVLGKENAYESIDFSGADIDGGYDLVVEYGASLSLDPMLRRDEILKLMPVFEKAGVEPRVIAQMLKLNELQGLYDFTELAENRQREIFEEMLATGVYIPPRELSDHKNMLAYSYRYVMTSEFKYLTKEQQLLIEKHIKEREQIMAKGAQPAGPAMPPAPPGMPPLA